MGTQAELEEQAGRGPDTTVKQVNPGEGPAIPCEATRPQIPGLRRSKTGRARLTVRRI